MTIRLQPTDLKDNDFKLQTADWKGNDFEPQTADLKGNDFRLQPAESSHLSSLSESVATQVIRDQIVA